MRNLLIAHIRLRFAGLNNYEELKAIRAMLKKHLPFVFPHRLLDKPEIAEMGEVFIEGLKGYQERCELEVTIEVEGRSPQALVEHLDMWRSWARFQEGTATLEGMWLKKQDAPPAPPSGAGNE